MKLAYQYRIIPNAEQQASLTRWLDMLRHQYNWLLAERFSWWEENRCPVNACPLICHLPELKDLPNYYGQKRSLVVLKQERPWYKELHSQVLQDMVRRVRLAFERFIQGDSQGKRSGKPRFKGKNRYRSFTYPQASIDWIDGNQIHLPKIGAVKVIFHRPVPDGFQVKTCIVIKKADGWYITLTLEDKSVPNLPTLEIEATSANSVGIDAGLEYFAACSDGTLIEPPKFFRRAEEKLARLQAKRDSRQKGSKARRKLNLRIARLHQKVARQRRQWHFELAGELVDKADVIFIEDLKVANMARRNQPKQDGTGAYLPNGQSAKSGLNKSFADAGISGFLNQILPYKAANAGKKVVKVNPAGTSQHCAICLNRVSKRLSDRWHDCPHCGASMPRDLNSGRLIQKVGLGVASLKNAKSRKRDGEARALCVA